MPIILEIDRANKVIFSTFTGEINEAEVLASVESMPTEPGFDPAFSHILDLSQVTGVRVSTAFIREFAERPPIFNRGAKQVIVAPQTHIFGLARMAQILRERQLPNIEVVRSLRSACEILKIQRAPNE